MVARPAAASSRAFSEPRADADDDLLAVDEVPDRQAQRPPPGSSTASTPTCTSARKASRSALVIDPSAMPHSQSDRSGRSLRLRGGLGDDGAELLAGPAGEALDRAADRDRRDDPAARASCTGADTLATPSSRSPTLCDPRAGRRRSSTLPGAARRQRAAGRRRGRSCAARAATRSTRRTRGRRRRGRTAAPTRRSARGATPAPGGPPPTRGTASAASWPRPMRRRPRQKRPSSSRRTSPCASRATASRWAVGRLSPVASPARPASAARASTAASTAIALSRTPTPLTLSTDRDHRLKM